MLPGSNESEDCRANRPAKKPGIKEKAISSPIWPVGSEATARGHNLTPPCACQLCGLVAFLLLSIVTLSVTTSYPQPTEQLRAWLGISPPELFLNIALAAYIIFELFYILLRSGNDGSRKFALKQLGFYLAFYFFFWYAGSLQKNFMLLAISGIILQTMESVRRAQICKQAEAEAMD